MNSSHINTPLRHWLRQPSLTSCHLWNPGKSRNRFTLYFPVQQATPAVEASDWTECLVILLTTVGAELSKDSTLEPSLEFFRPQNVVIASSLFSVKNVPMKTAHKCCNRRIYFKSNDHRSANVSQEITTRNFLSVWPGALRTFAEVEN